MLIEYEDCKDVYDWEVGTHGILINFTGNRTEVYNATFLPEVSKEQNWTKVETVKALVRKSGFKGTVNDELLKSISCTRYQSSKHRMTHEEWTVTCRQGNMEGNVTSKLEEKEKGGEPISVGGGDNDGCGLA